MHRQHQQVLIWVQANQESSEQGSPREIKRLLAFLAGNSQRRRLGLTLRKMRHVNDWNLYVNVRQNNLSSLALHRLKYGSQSLMASDDGANG